MSMDRPSYAVGRGRQAGSDAAAEAAAALAATSLVFAQHGDTVYANKLKATAMSLYALADATRGGFSISEPFYKVSPFCPPSLPSFLYPFSSFLCFYISVPPSSCISSLPSLPPVKRLAR